jgi:uncharacterized membrane protein YfcA
MARRQFNMPRAKRTVMGASGVLLGAWSALTGIAAQSAASPYIEFMLGYAPVKAGATAGVFALAAALFAVGSWTVALKAVLPWPIILCLALGATLGALVAAPVGSRLPGLRRIGQSLVVIAAAFVVSHAFRYSGQPSYGTGLLHTPLGWLVGGVACGALAQVMALPLGVFLVPVCVFAVGLHPDVAVVAALSVAGLAAVLPVVGYVTRGLADREIGPAMHIGGAIGASAGGWALARWATDQSAWPLAMFGVTAMMLCAWLAYRSR